MSFCCMEEMLDFVIKRRVGLCYVCLKGTVALDMMSVILECVGRIIDSVVCGKGNTFVVS